MKNCTVLLCTVLTACGVPEENLSQQMYATGINKDCHKHRKGKGHDEHQGYGYGHHKCNKDAGTREDSGNSQRDGTSTQPTDIGLQSDRGSSSQADLAEIYTWNNGKDNIAKFCEGYGLSSADVQTMMRDIQTLVLLRLVEVIQRMVMRAQQGGSFLIQKARARTSG